MRLISLLVLSFCIGCGGGGGGGAPEGTSLLPDPTPNLRPLAAPDIVVLSVSGRCGLGLFCDSPEDNMPYLGDPGDAAEAVMAAFQGAGFSTDSADFISSFYGYDDDGDGGADRRGFLDLVFLLDWLQANWISDFDNPTRIVIVAHSHGCVWAHIATSVRPSIPIAYLISLDANCLTWEGDYPPDITAYFNANGNPFTWDIRDPCDKWLVPGIETAQDTEDVVWSGVAVNLEVRSDDFFGVQDFQLNHRTDGSRANIFTFDSALDGHGDVHDPNGESMPWVLNALDQLGY